MSLSYKTKKREKKRIGESGFTLLEVLIAATILGVGLLAIGAGETVTVGTGRNSRSVSIATAAAEDMLERMRRNSANIAAYNNFDTTNAATQPPVTAVMLRADYDAWKAQIERPQPYGILGGKGTVVIVNGPIPLTRQATVTVTCAACPMQPVVIQTIF